MSLPPTRIFRAATYGLIALALAAVFWAYLDPQAVAALSTRLWSCVG